jgi:16S rRNA processing protein RimM
MEDLIAVGKIVKPHGAEGDLKITLMTPTDLSMSFIFVEFEGRPVPFYVEKAEQDGLARIHIESIDNKEDASPFSGKKIYLEASKVYDKGVENEAWLPLLAGFELFDQNKISKGKITEVVEYPYQIMAKIGEQLIPLHEDLILKIDPKQKRIYMNLPEGLLS